MKITVCMIVKNEEKVILRCLQSIVSCVEIAAVCICDTGSTDSTKVVVEEYLTSFNIPYKILDKEWKNFGYNRTESFIEAKKFSEELKIEDCYILFIDADMSLRIIVPKDKLAEIFKITKDETYDIGYFNGNMTYRKPTFVSIKNNWVSIGKTHEYWKIDEKDKYDSVYLPYLSIFEHNDGGCRDEKYQRDLRILQEEENDEIAMKEESVRTKFYIAQTYMALGEYGNALEYYKKRVSMGGWDEEVWYSTFMIATCMNKLGNPLEQVRSAYLNSYETRPSRAEPLYYLANYMMSCDRNHEAFTYISTARQIPFPFSDILFIEYKIYSCTADIIYSILANIQINSLKKSFSSVSNQRDKDRMMDLQNEIVAITKKLIFDMGIQGDVRKDIISILMENSCNLLNVYDVRTFETPKQEEIIYSSIIKIHEGYAYLIQRPNIIVVYHLGEDFSIVKSITALRISSKICNNPRLLHVDGKISIYYYDNETKKTRVSDIDGKEIDTLDGNGIVYRNKDGKIYLRTLKERTNKDGKNKISSNFNTSELELKFGPVILEIGEIWFCGFGNAFIAIFIENEKIVKMSIPFKLSLGDISSCTVNKSGILVVTNKDKFLNIDVRYILRILNL